MSTGSMAIDPRWKAAARILLVEDNLGDVYLLEKALQARGIVYELIHYQDGQEAITAINNDRGLAPDLILLDLNLPCREGFDVLTLVRSQPRLVGIPVGVLTSSAAASDRRRTSLIGADRYIHKPLTLEGFIDEVGRAVEELLSPAEPRP